MLAKSLGTLLVICALFVVGLYAQNILLQVLDITSSPNRVLYQVCYDKEKAIPQFTFHYLDDKCSSSGLVRPDVDPWYTVADVTDGTGLSTGTSGQANSQFKNVPATIKENGFKGKDCVIPLYYWKIVMVFDENTPSNSFYIMVFDYNTDNKRGVRVLNDSASNIPAEIAASNFLKSLIPDYATRLSGSYAPSADELFEMLSDNEDLSDIYGVDGESQ
nr:unnamed protein product [Naegleria fowleri]